MVQEATSRPSNAKDRVFNLIPDRNLLVAAVTLTLAVRSYLFWNYYTINNDGVHYIQSARDFWSGNWLAGLDSFYPPLFPLMLAVAFPMTGEWELAGQFWPLILGVLIILPLYGLLRRLFGQKVALVALFCYAVSPNLAVYQSTIRSLISKSILGWLMLNLLLFL
jgi:4-amino-4-deoxy-L-arabinose transferase-like glycosyltransferase